MYRILQIKMPLDFIMEDLKRAASKKIDVDEEDIQDIKIIRKSVDARNKNNVFFVIGADVELRPGVSCNLDEFKEEKYNLPQNMNIHLKNKPVIAGAGPAGIFAALALARAGLKPVVIERGKEIGKRISDVDKFEKTGVLNPESNIQFGEGGAGTFSDGKLTTGIKDIRVKKVLELFYEAGAPKEILYESKPHIGTDILRNVIIRLREMIISLGGEFLFETKLTGFEAENNRLKSITTVNRSGEQNRIDTDVLILAIGHSARDTFEMLYNKNIKMIQKPFSVGVRIEHKQLFINKSQYGSNYAHPALGAADYKLSAHLKNGRGVYTFCMCPGGYVVPAASEEKMVCVNGMSRHKRDGENANSAVLVGITPDDFAEDAGTLAGIEFQRKLELNAYKYGGGNYKAPVQLAEDFIKGLKTTKLQDVQPSYPVGYQMSNLLNIFPKFIQEALIEGLLTFNRQIEGFAGNGAVLTGVETRSSSPVRIIRNEKMQSNIEGIYPCGEGAGYAGGIMSAATDGIKAAESVINGELRIENDGVRHSQFSIPN